MSTEGMSTEGIDAELERLKAKRLAEMQKNAHIKMAQKEKSKTQDAGEQPPTPRDVVVAHLGFRGLEVLESAEVQFPAETRIIVNKLAGLIRSGELADVIDGGQLLSIFRMVGLPVKIATTIKVEEDGKFVSLSDRIKSRSC